MSIHLLECAANLTDLPASTKLALMAFADSADRTTNIALPGLEQVKRWSGLGNSQAKAVMADLVARGYLTHHRRGHRGRRAEYVVFPNGCCAEHRRPTYDQDESWELGSDQVAPLTGNGSGPPATKPRPDEAPWTGPEIGSGPPDPLQGIASGLGPAHRTPSLTTTTSPPSPQTTGGDFERVFLDTWVTSCTRHKDQPGENCRACGTTPRQLEAKAARAAADAKRLADQEASKRSRLNIVPTLDQRPAAQAAVAQARIDLQRQQRRMLGT